MVPPRASWLRVLAIGAWLACAFTSCTRESKAAHGNRVVAIGGPVTEIVYALGAGDRVVATDISSVYPAAATKLPQVGYQRTLAAEPILAQTPDLVIASADAGSPAVIEQLRRAGVRVEQIADARTPAQAAARIRAVGEVLHLDGKPLADRLVAEMAAVRIPATHPRVIVIYARGAGTLMVAGTDTSADAMLGLAGIENAARGFTGYKPLSAEALLAAAPDAIVIPARGLETIGGEAGLLGLPGVAETPAGKARRFIAIDDLLLLGFGSTPGRCRRGIGNEGAVVIQPQEHRDGRSKELVGASSDFGRPSISVLVRLNAVLVRPSVLGAVLAVMAIVAIGRGAVGLSPGRVLEALVGHASERDRAIVWTIRLPRVVLAMLVGGALAGSGTVLQGIARNPLADPALIGISGGAAVGAIVAAIAGVHSPWAMPVAAFVGAQIAVVCALTLARVEGQLSATSLLLGGIGLAALASAVTGLLIYLADDAVLRTITFWTLGSVGAASWALVIAAVVPIAIAVAVIIPLTRDLDRLQLGELEAHHVGVDVDRVIHRATFAVSLAVGAAVATCGVIGFIGLIVPYLARSAVGPATATLLPIAVLGGALLLVAADLAARTVVAPAELPVGVLTAALGAPVLLAIVRRART